MRLLDFPRRSKAPVGVISRVSVEARCCDERFARRRTAVFGLFRNLKCPHCKRRAFILDAITDRDWSRWAGGLAHERSARRARREATAAEVGQ